MQTVSNSPERTRELGEALGRLLKGGNVVALVGELGSGKTVLTQGLAKGLGVGPHEYVSSPSFALVNQYAGRLAIYHIDTYRLGGEAEMVALGYEEYLEPDGVTIIEWADKILRLLPKKYLLVNLTITGHNTRELSAELLGSWPAGDSAKIQEVFSGRAAGKT